MAKLRGDWATQQLAEFLATVSACGSPAEARERAIERAAEALEAEVAALVRDGVVDASIGFAADRVPVDALVQAASEPLGRIHVPGMGDAATVSVALEDEPPGRLVLARSGETFDSDELGLLRAMARVLSLTLQMLRGIENERRLRDREEHERAERLHAEGKYRRLVERLPAIVYSAGVGAYGAWTYVSPQIETILGFSPEEWLADPDLWAKRLHPDDRARVLQEEEEASADPASAPPTDYRMVARDGRVVWFLDDATLEQDERGSLQWHGALFDITDRKRAEAELKLRAAQQATVARLGEQALEGADLATVMDKAATAAAETLQVEYAHVLELLPGEQSLALRAEVGWPKGCIGSVVAPAGRRSQGGLALERGAPTVVEDWLAEQRFELPQPITQSGIRSGMSVIVEGSERPFGVFELQSRNVRVFSADDVNFVQSLANVLADAIERRVAEEEMRHQAVHDPLTKLPNRLLFLDRLSHALVQSRRRHTSVAALFLDLDHFKLINDSLGHAAGDELLTAVAPRLEEVLRAEDTVARFGGDEFGILLEDLGDERDAIDLAERIGAVFARPFVLNGVEHFVTSSIGIAIARGGNDKPDTLIRDADAAMYRAKERGRGRYELFDQVMRARAVERLQLENELRRALGQGELRVFYQPVISLRAANIVGVEALLRWQHPGRGLIGPDDFIRVAEESGMIEPIGRWVLEEACRQAATWHAERPDSAPISMSVNLSARQLAQPDLPDVVRGVVRASGIDPALLSLEITESALIEEVDAAVASLNTLREIGIKLVIDDFGTGYSSLAYLKRFPIDSIKIDRSFVDGLGLQQESTAIVSAIIAMARALSIGVIGEGVETRSQLAELRRLGLKYAQGYYFARPQPASEIGPLLDRRFRWLGSAASSLTRDAR